MILHEAFFSDTVVYQLLQILSGVSQYKNHSADISLSPDRLLVVRVILSYLTTNFCYIHSCIFGKGWHPQDKLC